MFGVGCGSGVRVVLICVQMQCLNVMVTGCLCVCGVLDDVSISATTALTDMMISE